MNIFVIGTCVLIAGPADSDGRHRVSQLIVTGNLVTADSEIREVTSKYVMPGMALPSSLSLRIMELDLLWTFRDRFAFGRRPTVRVIFTMPENPNNPSETLFHDIRIRFPERKPIDDEK
jgi:hypothetical protein